MFGCKLFHMFGCKVNNCYMHTTFPYVLLHMTSFLGSNFSTVATIHMVFFRSEFFPQLNQTRHCSNQTHNTWFCILLQSLLTSWFCILLQSLLTSGKEQSPPQYSTRYLCLPPSPGLPFPHRRPAGTLASQLRGLRHRRTLAPPRPLRPRRRAGHRAPPAVPRHRPLSGPSSAPSPPSTSSQALGFAPRRARGSLPMGGGEGKKKKESIERGAEGARRGREAEALLRVLHG